MQKVKSKSGTLLFLSFFITLLLQISSVFGFEATLSWVPSTDPSLSGYKIYYGSASRSYGTPIDVGNQSTYTVTGLDLGTTYFAVTAYNAFGFESGFSNETSKTFTEKVSTSGATAPSETPSGGGCSVVTSFHRNTPDPGQAAEIPLLLGFVLLRFLKIKNWESLVPYQARA